jgi:hypothetical protein
MKTIDDIVQRLRGEYLEMPGLRLTPAQVQRLCGIEPRVCQSVLDALVNAKFLVARADGHYARLTGEQIQRSPAFATEPMGARTLGATHATRLSDPDQLHRLGTRQGNDSDLARRSSHPDEVSPNHRGNVHDTFVTRPERRRARSDAEIRTEWSTLERRLERGASVD